MQPVRTLSLISALAASMLGIAGAEEQPPGVPTGVALGTDGTIYLSADRDGSILRLRRVTGPGQGE